MLVLYKQEIKKLLLASFMVMYKKLIICFFLQYVVDFFFI